MVEAETFGQKACLNGFRTMSLPAQLSDAVIIGDVFLRKYITQFDMDNNRVGFAVRA